MSDDKTLWQLIKDDLGLNKYTLEVGFMEDATYSKDGMQVAQVAKWLNDGTFNADTRQVIPPRPFMDITDSQSSDEWLKVYENGFKADKKTQEVLNLVGMKMMNDIKRTITKLQEPPNAQSTIEAKGSANPLIDTGHMRDSVTWKVEKK